MLEVVFRTDASLSIGSGHVMRCLTLADELKRRGAVCGFICRANQGNQISQIHQRGFEVQVLRSAETVDISKCRKGVDPRNKAFSDLRRGIDEEMDAAETRDVIGTRRVDWLVVDHYELGQIWETRLSDVAERILVIDDLANRPHRAALLLDQNLGRAPQDYASLTGPDTRLLVGPHYSLMKPDFAKLRPAALTRKRALVSPRRVLVALGGVDPNNVTVDLLRLLACNLPVGITSVDVVLGKYAPHQAFVRSALESLNIQGSLYVDTPHMARLVTEADIAIGAAGVSAWERCALGVPTLLVMLAENQLSGAHALVRAGAGLWLGERDQIRTNWSHAWECLQSPGAYQRMQACAASIADGLGADRVVTVMEELS